MFAALYFLIQKIFPKTLSYPHCLAEGIIPACFVPKAELISNACPGVSAEPLWLSRESELANGTGHQGSCAPLLQAKREEICDFIQVFSFWTCIDEVKDPKTVLLNKWEDFDTGSISFQ